HVFVPPVGRAEYVVEAIHHGPGRDVLKLARSLRANPDFLGQKGSGEVCEEFQLLIHGVLVGQKVKRSLRRLAEGIHPSSPILGKWQFLFHGVRPRTPAVVFRKQKKPPSVRPGEMGPGRTDGGLIATRSEFQSFQSAPGGEAGGNEAAMPADRAAMVKI